MAPPRTRERGRRPRSATSKVVFCPYCGKDMTPKALTQHYKRMHPHARAVSCLTCRDSFATVRGVETHLGRAHGLGQRVGDVARFNRKTNLKAKHNLTIGDYEIMLARQRGRCAICGSDQGDSLGKRLHVDHNHATGQIRALLCGRCNTVIGRVDESVDVLLAMARYITEWAGS